jgi:hypothetical protein
MGLSQLVLQVALRSKQRPDRQRHAGQEKREHRDHNQHFDKGKAVAFRRGRETCAERERFCELNWFHRELFRCNRLVFPSDQPDGFDATG